jgi:choline kinase
VPSWSQKATHRPVPCIRKATGCLTNAVFFVSSPSTSSRTLLLRVYGPSSGPLLSRRRELQVLQALASSSNLGPRIYGTFTNGRLEEYFDSVTLTASDIREPRISASIGARMAELHSIDVATIEEQSHGTKIEIGVRKNVHSWLPHARSVLALPAIAPAIRKELDLDKFEAMWSSYMRWLETAHLDARPVFCHNETQYGNILRLNEVKEGTPDHHQVRPPSHPYLLSHLTTSPNSDGFFLRPVLRHHHRSSSSTLNMLPRTQPPSTSRTTFTSGRSTTTGPPHTCSTPRVIRITPSDARSLPPTSSTASTYPHSRTYLPRPESVNSSR